MEISVAEKHWRKFKFYSLLLPLAVYLFFELVAYWNDGSIRIFGYPVQNDKMGLKEFFVLTVCPVVILGKWAFHLTTYLKARSPDSN